MPISKSSSMFKIIAVRALPGSAEYIRKCIGVNQYYYLCNDYSVSEDGRVITRRSGNIAPLADDFFDLSEKHSMGVGLNFSAIVGMNGDGKSSLVELIIRLLNNVSISHGIGDRKTLQWINGVEAELYYLLDGVFYRIISKGDRIKVYQYVKSGKEYRQSGIVGPEVVKKHFFYTMVSNYSLYAYNSLEFAEEWDGNGTSKSEEKCCWLHRVFHKNDGYQTPLSLHPYRSYGNIDMNREKFLSMQRLLSLMVHPQSSQSGINPFRLLNNKRAECLKLEDIGYSKLQDVTIKAFFLKHKDTNLLQEDIAYLEEEDEKDWNMWKTNGINKLAQIYHRFIDHRDNRILFRLALDYAERNNLLSHNSDVSQMIKILKDVCNDQDWKDSGDLTLKEVEELEGFQAFNLCQIQRLELIDAVCDYWRYIGVALEDGRTIKLDMRPELIFKSYEDMSVEEKCKHYIIYKTISIFETYSTFGYPCAAYENDVILTGIKKEDDGYGANIYRLKVAFNKLQDEWNYKSHITLKIRQAFNYLSEGGSSKIYRDKRVWEKCGIGEVVSLDKISERYGAKLMDMEYLPPAIYMWQIYFQKDSSSCLIPFDSLSSGEKQRYFSVGAIVYHLLNIDSIGSGSVHYKAVNLILEEIELYFHPEWQRSFTFYLMEMIRQIEFKQIKSINVVYVTHSPYILSDIPKTNVLFLKNGNADYSMQENTFGANINGLLRNGFFLPSLPMGEFAHRKINRLFAMLHSGDFKDSELEGIRQEILLVGEPVIRQQLMALYNIYRKLNTELDDDAFRRFISKKLDGQQG